MAKKKEITENIKNNKKKTKSKEPNEVVLELKSVGYRYKDAKENDFVLKNINYAFEKGKMYAIRGKSGTGKTTLLSLISGLEKCSEGEIYYKDKNLNKMDLDTYRNTDIGIIFQSYNLLPHLTALENIILSMDISKVKVDNPKEKALELLEKVGLDSSYANRRILKLSGGEQQRVAIARSLSYNPEIILADEPTGNLDRETEDEILNIFNHLSHKENKCIIIVTHSKNVSDNVDVVYDLKKKKEPVTKL
jgi:putative ABC transport system ATP-binding protein